MKEWEDYLNSKIKGEYSCILEEYKDYNLVFPKGQKEKDYLWITDFMESLTGI